MAQEWRGRGECMMSQEEVTRCDGPCNRSAACEKGQQHASGRTHLHEADGALVDAEDAVVHQRVAAGDARLHLHHCSAAGGHEGRLDAARRR